MKKLICMLLTALMLLSACALAEGANVAALKGPTAMGMVKLMQDDAGANYNFEICASADEITPRLMQGEIDIAALPANLAAVLYNRSEGKIQALAVNTLGVLYIAERGDSVHAVSDLAGRTIYSAGKGSTPEFALNYILSANGLTPGEDVTIEYMSEATEVLAAMQASSGYPVAMLPQPYVTTAQMQMEGLKVALDMTEEWGKVSPDSALVTGVVVARKEFVEQNEAAFNEFLEDYKASTEFVNANVDEAAALVAGYEIVPKEPIAQKALPECNITFISGADMKAKVSGYLKVLYDQNPEAVGGTLPDDAFYYGA